MPTRTTNSDLRPCPPKPDLADRPLISTAQADGLEELFKVLANGTRLRLMHAIVRAGELCVIELADAVAMKPQAVSNQLRRLVDRGILEGRRDGNNVYYRLVDPCVASLLDRGQCLLEDAQAREHAPR